MDDLKTYYLSIVDTTKAAGQRFFGACIIKAGSPDNITRILKETGLFPSSAHGEIAAVDVSHLKINPDWLYRLMTKDEAEQEHFLIKD